MRSMSREITTVGGNGAATGTGTFGIGTPSRVRSVIVQYAGGQPAQTVVIADRIRTILTLAAGNTTRVVNPTEPVHDSAGVAIANAVAGGPQVASPVCHGAVTATVTLGNAAVAAVTVTLILED